MATLDSGADLGPSGRIRQLRQYLAGLTQQHVLAVLQDFSLEEAAQYGYSDSADYDLIHNSQRYPPKAVLGLAAGQLLGQALPASSFTGGLSSPCFHILENLGFTIAPKPALRRYQQYDRYAISQLFEPGCTFSPGAGRWGIPGIVETPKDSGHFVFLVTLGKPVEGNPYQDALTTDGYLIWESQTRHSFKSKAIQQLLVHNEQQHNVHLFLRPTSNSDYFYMGLLAYHSHDPQKTNPVHFVWRILNWDLSPETLQTMLLPVLPALNPTYSAPKTPAATQTLQRVAPPQATTSSHKRTGKKPASGNVDWAARDERNRDLGLQGEKLVLQYEIDSLRQCCRHDLAEQVQHIALSNSAAGYDIASFYPDGRPKLIEVKTTQGPSNTPFYISANEVLVSQILADAYVIYRVFDFKAGVVNVSFFEMTGSAEQNCKLEAVSFKAQPVML
ncbi:DUF3427 domain-containing protein [Vogesella sp. LIG4]|uniref:DUF3427 domain-containing protein n=1 Tax=Vogesella sp. LIG4 TaxID=1192162 RepID=UPI00081FEA79|nr:DUF3427 domain-containing protein [Vogesella sp. LIG4]SCK11597.1 protein of unknown function [Vogesella sp. LIG4]